MYKVGIELYGKMKGISYEYAIKSKKTFMDKSEVAVDRAHSEKI